MNIINKHNPQTQPVYKARTNLLISQYESHLQANPKAEIHFSDLNLSDKHEEESEINLSNHHAESKMQCHTESRKVHSILKRTRSKLAMPEQANTKSFPPPHCTSSPVQVPYCTSLSLYKLTIVQRSPIVHSSPLYKPKSKE